jgi:hypothetical protein
MATRLTPTALAKSPQISASATGAGPIEGRMTKRDRDFGAEKADRALVLHEQGISRATIAGRLCVRPVRVEGIIKQAEKRREKKIGELVR